MDPNFFHADCLLTGEANVVRNVALDLDHVADVIVFVVMVISIVVVNAIVGVVRVANVVAVVLVVVIWDVVISLLSHCC